MNGTIRIKSITATYYCKCGQSIRLTGTEQGIRNALKLWAAGHQGEGHEPCDKKTCLKARKG